MKRALEANGREYWRRAAALVLVVLAFVAPAQWGWAQAAGLAGLAACAYVLPPRPRPPEGAATYAAFPAVIGPDIVGLLLTSFFVALPFWIRAGEHGTWSDLGLLVHPSALVTWPLAAVSAVILVMAARNASFWILFGGDALRVRTAWGERKLAYRDLASVKPWRRGLPGWLSWLTPLLVLSGRFTAAGALILARDAHGVKLTTKDGTTLIIGTDALTPAVRKRLHALGGDAARRNRRAARR